MAEPQEGPADQSGVSKPTPKFHADIRNTYLGDTNSPRGHIRDLYWSSDELFTDGEKREAFAKAATITKEYSEALIERWIKEIDTYLVYAGLFSAILTAFNVESYQLLQPAPPDPSPAILQQISLQLSSLSYIPPSINSTHLAFSSSDNSVTTSSAVPTWAIWLNALWFSGLVLSLSAASVGILVKQWLNEFQSGLAGDSEHIARLRQRRLNNLKRCHVGSIVNTIPVLLQGALALFLVGLLVLLWNLHRAVAAVTSFFVLAIAVFIVSTTIAPLITSHCAYLSPQSLVIYALWPYIPHLTRKWLSAFKAWLSGAVRRAQAFAGLPPPTTTQDRSANTPADSGPPQQSWMARERSFVDHHSGELERDMALTAYEATLDSDVVVSTTARVVDWGADETLRWFVRLVEIDKSHFGRLKDHLWTARNSRLHGEIFYGLILLCTTLEGHLVVGSAIPRQLVKTQFTNHLGSFWLFGYETADNASDSLRAKMFWITATYAALALYAAEAEPESDIQPSSPPGLSDQQLGVNRVLLDVMAMDIDYGARAERYNEIMITTTETYVSLASLTLRASNYSLEKAFEHLGTYLHGHALLFYVIALRSRQSHVGQSKFPEEGMKDALSGLSATLDCLSRSRLNDGREHSMYVEEDIIRPVSHILHALSCELDSFRPLLPPNFCVNLQTFFAEFRRSVLYEEEYWIRVPWKEVKWYPSDLYDAAQELIEKLRDSANQNTRAARPSQSDSDTPSQPSPSSAPHQNEEMSQPAGPRIDTAETLPSMQLHSGVSQGLASTSCQADVWLYYGDDFSET